ncbi:MAG: acyl-CoA thioesterase [Gemmatimonadota bacterium]
MAAEDRAPAGDGGPDGSSRADEPDGREELPAVVGDGDASTVKPVARSQVTMTNLMAPQDTNLIGSVFGGVILAAVDKIAYVCASRHAGRTCVTASFDQVNFKSPVEVGEIVTLKASVNTVGRTSLEVGVRVSAETVHGAESRHTNSCYVTMVAVNEEREPVEVPRLKLETADQLRRHRDAVERKKARLELAESRRARREEAG